MNLYNKKIMIINHVPNSKNSLKTNIDRWKLDICMLFQSMTIYTSYQKLLYKNHALLQFQLFILFTFLEN